MRSISSCRSFMRVAALAQRYMQQEGRGNTLQATALVNEAYLRLIDLKRIHWQSRTHFFAMAARVMRRILVDAARARKHDKRGRGFKKVSFDEALLVSKEPTQDLVALETVHPRKSRVVELRFFGGLSIEETAEPLQMSPDTVKRDLALREVVAVARAERIAAMTRSPTQLCRPPDDPSRQSSCEVLIESTPR